MPHHRTVSLAGSLIVSLLIGRSAVADTDRYARFFDDVRPLLETKCIQCHGPDKQKGGLRLDSRAALLKGGVSGPALVNGDPERSLLVQAVRHTHAEIRMPPKEKLKDGSTTALAAWVQDGAVWPASVAILFEDEEALPPALTEGQGEARLDSADRHRGLASLLVRGQRQAPVIPGWRVPIRERPGPGEYRFLRFAWKKRGSGAAYVEFANDGQWRKEQQQTNAAFVAGKNTTGWAAHNVGDQAPDQWTVVTRDLWHDGGTWKDFTLTGICVTAVDGGELLLDSIILGPTRESLDAYAPGRGQLVGPGAATVRAAGDAWSDPNNPIRRIFKGERLDLWSLQKPARPIVPAVKDSAWPRTSVDRFVLARLESKGLTPSPQADRRTLVRRLYFDLVGLPPPVEDVANALNDQSPEWFERVVDRLLASPHYGERWARHWLDVVRYADTNGFERDEFRPFAWQYRDYVIRSFNRDKPYHQFIREQLAGDELPNADTDARIATGYLRLGPFDSTRALFQEDAKGQDELMADLVNTTGSAFLGLTLACCQCHDHKYDPLSQADHFRMRSFFAAVKFRDDWVIDAVPPRKVMGASDSGPSAPPTRVFFQGDFTQPREEVQPGFLSVFTPNAAIIGRPTPNTTGRRLALADWIAAPDNPWTARVLVNRLWQHHFGKGIVATPNDFGFSGAHPTHPDLLDWLANEFVAGGGSIKQLHRLIVCSAVYRQASVDEPQRRVLDPENTLLWRQNVRRLDAETLRDSLFAVSGLLRPYVEGKPLWPPVPQDILKAQPGILEALDGKDEGRRQGWYTDPLETTDVRSIFLVRKRSLPLPFLQVFDLPDSTVSCARRNVTTVAPQALTLLNSPEALRIARAFAERVAQAAGSDPARRVEQAVWRALGRAPDKEEGQRCLDLLRRHTEQHRKAATAEADQQALVDLCRALLNINEFIYVD